MSDQPAPQSSVVLYQTEDGQTRVQCRFEDGSIWLTQPQIAELFQTSVPNVNLHLKDIFSSRELAEGATIQSYLIVRTEGSRTVSRAVLHYRLEAIQLLPPHKSHWQIRGSVTREIPRKTNLPEGVAACAFRLPQPSPLWN